MPFGHGTLSESYHSGIALFEVVAVQNARVSRFNFQSIEFGLQ
jgi:hypothetical protein